VKPGNIANGRSSWPAPVSARPPAITLPGFGKTAGPIARSPLRLRCPPGAVHRLAFGRRRAQPGTAAAVLTVTGPALPRARLDATGTRLRLRALHVVGHGSARIARAAGIMPAAG
jgi:hypothetical protein